MTNALLPPPKTLTAEYVRQSRKAEKEAQAIEDRYQSFEKRIEELEYLNDKQAAEIKNLSRFVYSNQSASQSAAKSSK